MKGKVDIQICLAEKSTGTAAGRESEGPRGSHQGHRREAERRDAGDTGSVKCKEGCEKATEKKGKKAGTKEGRTIMWVKLKKKLPIGRALTVTNMDSHLKCVH